MAPDRTKGQSQQPKAHPTSQYYCKYCKLTKDARGFVPHQKKCKRDHENLVANQAYVEALRLENAHSQGQPAQQSQELSHPNYHLDEEGAEFELPAVPSGMIVDPEPAPHPLEPEPQMDDIRVEYHPHSKIPSKTVPFDQFSREANIKSARGPDEPWYPFETREDFELAEIALQAAIKKEHFDALLKLIRRCADSKGSVTLSSHDQMKETWTQASVLLTPVLQGA